MSATIWRRIALFVEGEVDKQAFAAIFGERAQNLEERIVLLQQILAVYDWGFALQRSVSLRYCAVKLGIAA